LFHFFSVQPLCSLCLCGELHIVDAFYFWYTRT